jgi:hypothetical protein
MLDPKNPFDPFDQQRRWLRSLYPAERWLVYAAAAAVIIVMLLWVTK